MKNVVKLLLLFLAVNTMAQTNLLPDPSFESGTISGGNDDYYNYDGKVLWRAWPFIGFETDTENTNSGSRSLKVVYRNYGSGDPTFRTEAYPELEPGTYQFSFYYKTDIDRSASQFSIDIKYGTQAGGTTSIGIQQVPIVSEAKDGFVQLMIEFEADENFTTFAPYIKVPFITDGAYYYMDDVKLTKLSTEVKATSPSPAHEATGFGTNNAKLEWLGGVNAVKRNVYVGTASNDLQQVATDITGTMHTLPKLENETEYFWRVDEIDGSDVVTTGDVWSFTTKTYYEENMEIIQTQRVESDKEVTWEQFGPGNAGFVNFLRYHPLLPDVCLTSPDMFDTYQTEDNGDTWNTVKDVDGESDFARLYDMFYSTKTAKFAIAIESSRLYTSNDTARSWTVINNCPWYTHKDVDGSEGRSWYRKVSAVAIDPNNDDTWYVGAGNFCRGQQQLWSTVSNPTYANPRGDENIYDNIKYQGKIWKTTDAGATWTELNAGLNEKAQFSRIIVHPENSQVIFAGSQYGLFKSTDGGSNWTDIGDGKLDNNTIMNMDYYYDATSNRFVLYVADQVRYHPAGTTTTCDGGIFKSEDDGATWTNINGNLGLDINRLSGGVPDNYYQYIAKWFGITKAEAQSTYPAKPTAALQYFNSLNVDPSGEDALLVGFYDAQVQKSITPGRLWKTTNGGDTWINIARDYAPAWQADQAYWSSRNNPYTDNMEEGHQISNQQWGQNYPLRSLRYCAVNSRGDIMLLYAHNTFRSTDGGETFIQIDETYTNDGNIMPAGNSNLPGQCIWQDKRLGEGILYCGSGEHHLWKTTNDGLNGKQAVKYLNGTQESIFAGATHPWDENTVYTTSMRQKDLDRIFRSTDGGDTFVDWGKATEASEWMRTNHIRIDPINPDNMYFGVTEISGSGGGGGTDGPDKDKEGGFHKSSNAGKSFNPSNSGMPQWVWVRDIEFDPRDDTRASIFVAAPWNKEKDIDGGLFHSANRGTSWTEIPVSDKIEGVNNICFDHTGRLYATAGRRAAAGNAGGLFYSDDYGQNWTQIFEAEYVDNFDISPFDHNLLVFSMGELAKNPGIFISKDRGITWSKANHRIGTPNRITQVEFDLHDPSRLWLSVMASGFSKGYLQDGADHKKITVTPGVGEIDQNETLQLQVVAPDLTGTIQYKSANPSVATVSASGEVKGVGKGAVKIWVTSEDGRYSDFVYLVVSGTDIGIKDEKQIDLSLYPNPAKNELYIKGDFSGSITMKLFLPNGALVKQINNINGQSINIADLNKGLYFYLLENHEGVATGKLIKE
ncbi:VPS10 domain-containing protein [Labilibacter marinus]|uniref:VPS10 domain-containing protein n=1 Tax=Labilibacter marinus TaxID=1477105 RepID=UPI00082D7864|nr:T9SS type A sorting domain-containing protein [Labilibacter marinus]